VQTFDNRTCEILAPRPSGRAENAQALNLAKTLAQHQTAVVILENFSERRLGPEFRDRSCAWFLELRGLGYEHIIFLQGADVPDPEHLITLAKYD
jgi:hypothetical protein